MAYGGDTPTEWTAEHEMEVPAPWRDHDMVEEGRNGPQTRRRRPGQRPAVHQG